MSIAPMPLSQLIYKLSGDPVYNCYWYDYGDSLDVCSLDEYYSHLDYDTGTADRLAVITTEGDIALLGDDGKPVTPHLLKRANKMAKEMGARWVEKTVSAWKDAYEATKAEADA